MRKRVLCLALSFVILIAVIALGTHFVFKVDTVVVYYNVLSEKGVEYSVSIQKDLEEAYIGKNTLFVTEDEADEVLSNYPYVKGVSVRKIFPDKIAVYAEETPERFAVQNSSGSYDMLDEEGTYLSTRESNENYSDGFRNILLTGFGEYSSSFTESEAFEAAKTICDYMHTAFNGVRANLSAISYVHPTSDEADAYFELSMTEGVTVRIYTPLSSTEEKCASVVERYLSLAPEDRLYGLITVVDKADGSGEFITSYSEFLA